MGLEIIVFIAAILFGILLYWRESNGNGLYKFVNKLVNSKELQMKSTETKGFVYKQAFLPRLVYVVALFLLIAVVLQFLTPLEIFGSFIGLSFFSSSIVGTLIGSYIASFVIKSGVVIEEKSDSLEDIVSDVVEKGKDIVDDVKDKASEVVDDIKSRTSSSTNDTIDTSEEAVKEYDLKEQKSARERLKDKGLM